LQIVESCKTKLSISSPRSQIGSFGFFCHVFIFTAYTHYGEGRYHFMGGGSSNGPFFVFHAKSLKLLTGFCKYAAIISIINLGLDLVRESKYPKSIYFELYSATILLSLDLLKMVS
jgi:hypothetical protein